MMAAAENLFLFPVAADIAQTFAQSANSRCLPRLKQESLQQLCIPAISQKQPSRYF
jgi:hypothetical protein